MAENEDLYEILHLHLSAPPDVIQAAYRRLAMLYHPDKNPSGLATEQMAALNRSYAVLGNPDKRAEYDRLRPAQSKTPVAQPESGGAPSQPQKKPGRSNPDYITIGSRKNDVAGIHGPPISTCIHEELKEEFWHYSDFGIYFNKSGRVIGWSVYDRALNSLFSNMDSLKIHLFPGANVTTSSFFTIDSHKDDVARLQGTPLRVIKEWDAKIPDDALKPMRYFYTRESWVYLGGTVEFSISTGRITAWDNRDGSRKAQRRWQESDTGWKETDFFTLGSTKREVERTQGKPVNKTKVATGAEEWQYDNRGMSKVEFRSGRVQGWTNIVRDLRVTLVPGPNVTSHPLFSLDSHKDDVARLQAAPPFSIHVVRILDEETWLFSAGSIKFSHSSGRVIDYENKDGSLKGQGIRPEASAVETRRSTVRAAQGGGCGCLLPAATVVAITFVAATFLA